MGVEIPIGFAQVEFTWTVAGDAEPMVCTIGVSPAVGDDAADIASALDTAWLTEANAASMVNNQYTIGPTTARYRVGAGDPVVATLGTPTPGTATGAALPNNCAMLIQKRTAIGGRRNRGRMFVPPCWQNEAGVTAAGVIDSGSVATIQTRLNSFLAAVEGDARALVILHSDGGTPTQISSLTLASVIATQRRRLRP